MAQKKQIRFINDMPGLLPFQGYICSIWKASDVFDWIFNPIDWRKVDGAAVVLNEDGTIVYKEDTTSDSSRILNDTDFLLILRIVSGSEKLCIPVSDGKICEDKSQWEFPIEIVLVKIFKRVSSGYKVWLDDEVGFLPDSLLLDPTMDKQDIVLRMVFDCIVVASDGIELPVVKQVGRFIEYDEWKKSQRF